MTTEIPITTGGEIKILPATEIEEIVQNVRTIILTQKYSVPLDREFGIDAKALDMPILAAQARLTAEVATAINRFEPRAKLKKLQFDGDGATGKLIPILTIEIN